MPSTIFSGQKIKTLKDTLTLNGKSDIISSTTDPTASAVDAPIGSLLINQTSGNLYRKLDAGSSTNWELVGSGNSGINYILNPSAEVNTTGWSTYADAAGATPVDGTGGSPTITWTRSTTTPLRGVADFNLTKGASNVQGQGVSYTFTIDQADKAKVLTVSFDYEVLSGTYADGDLTVYLIADPTGTPVVIQPAGYTVLSATTGTTMKQQATFQTQATTTSYRLCFHIASTSALAYTLAIDNVVVGPQTRLYGSPITDWKAYTPTWASSGVTQPAIGDGSISGRYRRVGNAVEVEIHLISGATTTYGSNFYTFSLPSGLSKDALSEEILGVASARGWGGANTYLGYVVEISGVSTTTSVAIRATGATTSAWGTSLPAAPSAATAGQEITLFFTTPITGWSSSVEMSQDTDTRVVAMINYSTAATGTVASTFAGSTDINFGAADYDTHGSFNGTTTYRIPVSGFYSLTATTQVSSTGVSAGLQYTYIAVNGVAAASQYLRISDVLNTTRMVTATGSSYLNAGDLITVRAAATTTTPTLNSTANLIVQRLSGPATISAGETVSARYTTSTTTISSISSAITYTVKVYDTHNAYSSNRFTAPVNGKYAFTGSAQLSSATASAIGARMAIRFIKNGTIFSETGHYIYEQTTTALSPVVFGYAEIDCIAGDQIQVAATINTTIGGGSVALNGSASTNYICVTKIGN